MTTFVWFLITLAVAFVCGAVAIRLTRQIRALRHGAHLLNPPSTVLRKGTDSSAQVSTQVTGSPAESPSSPSGMTTRQFA